MPGKRTDPQFNFRVPAESLDAYRSNASACGLTVGEWARAVLDHAAGVGDLREAIARGADAARTLESERAKARRKTRA